MKTIQIQRPQLSGMSIKRIAREATSLGISVDELVDRALLALADEIDFERSHSAARISGQLGANGFHNDGC